MYSSTPLLFSPFEKKKRSTHWNKKWLSEASILVFPTLVAALRTCSQKLYWAMLAFVTMLLTASIKRNATRLVRNEVSWCNLADIIIQSCTIMSQCQQQQKLLNIYVATCTCHYQGAYNNLKFIKTLSIPDTLDNLLNRDHSCREGIHQTVHQCKMGGLKNIKNRDNG